MSMIITEDCINCRACAVECPAKAIYEPGKNYVLNGLLHNPISEEHFFIVTELCDECSGFNRINCIVVCPMDAIKKI
ncbi:4Fe-4S dicluster domain-containing protein [Ignavibacteria bacterium 4148-Me]|uniref:4Fe-4S dicluster domain-containing protein n=1 Tax=Rosettibacter primus TaxID=3111523 RepID=UPI00336BECDC